MLNFPRTDLNQVLSIFQELAGMTLVHPPVLPASSIALYTATPLTRAEAIYAMTAVLALNGVSIAPISERFLFAFPSSQSPKLTSLLARKAFAHNVPEKQMVSPDSVRLSWAGLEQVGSVYQELCGQRINLEPGLSGPRFSIRLQAPAPAGEVLGALDLLLAWENLEVVVTPGNAGLRLVHRPSSQP